MAHPLAIINIHTPTASFAILHSLNEDSLEHLFDKLSRKSHTDFHGQRVGPGWIKYHWNESYWNLDDDADYTIFVWRQKTSSPESSPNLSASITSPTSTHHPSSSPHTPTLHIHDPTATLPAPPAYRNPSFYLFLPQSHLGDPEHHRSSSLKSGKSKTKSTNGGKGKKGKKAEGEMTGIPKHKIDFEKFHSENGVRTVMGSIGPVHNVRMLLKSGYRHVYISRKFAMKHGFIPTDAAPGHYGYGGLVNIGIWPIVLQPLGSSSLDSHFHNNTNGKNNPQPKSTPIPVYLSEEPHFDVVLGRSFFERRQIKTNPTDPTEVICLDTGERVEVEVVVLKDGRGEIVIVT